MTKDEFKEHLRIMNRMEDIEIEEIDLPFDSCLFRQYGNVNTRSDMLFDGGACETPEEQKTINETIDLLKLTVKSLECVDWHRTHEGYNSIISIFGNYMIPVSEEEAAKELKRRNDSKKELMPWDLLSSD